MRIFDIDGTLTHPFGEIEDTTGFHSYAFWDLLTDEFVESKETFRAEIAAWNESMKTEPDPTGSSHAMMQRAIAEFRAGISGEALRAKAKDITVIFLDAGIVRLEAVSFLKRCLASGETCVLSTGSYLDGAFGFVDALVERDLLTADLLDKLHISGAEVDWASRELLHANVRERKILGLKRCLGVDELPAIAAVYCDDPEINDKGIYEAAPADCRFVIATERKRERLEALGIPVCTWAEIIPPPSSFVFAGGASGATVEGVASAEAAAATDSGPKGDV